MDEKSTEPRKSLVVKAPAIEDLSAAAKNNTKPPQNNNSIWVGLLIITILGLGWVLTSPTVDDPAMLVESEPVEHPDTVTDEEPKSTEPNVAQEESSNFVQESYMPGPDVYSDAQLRQVAHTHSHNSDVSAKSTVKTLNIQTAKYRHYLLNTQKLVMKFMQNLPYQAELEVLQNSININDWPADMVNIIYLLAEYQKFTSTLDDPTEQLFLHPWLAKLNGLIRIYKLDPQAQRLRSDQQLLRQKLLTQLPELIEYLHSRSMQSQFVTYD